MYMYFEYDKCMYNYIGLYCIVSVCGRFNPKSSDLSIKKFRIVILNLLFFHRYMYFEYDKCLYN